MQVNKGNLIGTVFGVLLVLASSPGFADTVVDQGRQLLDEGKGRAAWELLESRESERAGDTYYDFLLGLAALEVGENTRAVFALERVLALDPSNLRARAEIARAYLALGEAETARQEFETVRRQGVPADVSLTLERYIAAAKRMEKGERATLNGYVEAQFGYDSNVNAGPNRSSITFPSGFSVPLPPDVKANEDVFAQLGAGANASLPVNANLSFLAGVSGSSRGNFDKGQFNIGSADANAGAVVSLGRNVLTLMGQAGLVTLESSNYRSVFGVTGQWQHNLDARNQVSIFGQYAEMNYLTNRQRDVTRRLGGISYAHMWREGAVAFGSAYLLNESPERPHNSQHRFDGYGMRLGGRLSVDEKTIFFGGVSYERRAYAKALPADLGRQDDQYGVVLGATHAIASDWTLTPQLSLTFNRSNLELNDYHREVVSLAIRREF